MGENIANTGLSGTYQKEAPTVCEWRHYDGFNQLIRINQEDKEITYQYLRDGLRHSTQVRKLTESQRKTNLYCCDGSNIVAELSDSGYIKTYLRGINLIAREIDGVVYYYIFNEHGDVTQLWSQSGTCKASYEYDAFGIERDPDNEDENPFRVKPLKEQVKAIVFKEGTALSLGESKTIDLTTSMTIENGEDIVGYQYLHGTNADVGGFKIKGTISKNEKGDITYDLAYTWNDRMDPNFIYDSDSKKAQFAKSIPGANPKDYTLRITWNDKTVIKANPGWFNWSKGWLS